MRQDNQSVKLKTMNYQTSGDVILIQVKVEVIAVKKKVVAVHKKIINLYKKNKKKIKRAYVIQLTQKKLMRQIFSYTEKDIQYIKSLEIRKVFINLVMA